MRITREIGIDYGHTLPNHYTFCNQIHGHRGRVIATVSGPIKKKSGDSSEGMVLDFKFLKQIMMEYIHDPLDHGFAVWEKDEEDRDFILKRNKKWIITPEPPTAEYLAKWAYEHILLGMAKYSEETQGIILESVVWYETPNSYATYTIDDYD